MPQFSCSIDRQATICIIVGYLLQTILIEVLQPYYQYDLFALWKTLKPNGSGHGHVSQELRLRFPLHNSTFKSRSLQNPRAKTPYNIENRTIILIEILYKDILEEYL